MIFSFNCFFLFCPIFFFLCIFFFSFIPLLCSLLLSSSPLSRNINIDNRNYSWCVWWLYMPSSALVLCVLQVQSEGGKESVHAHYRLSWSLWRWYDSSTRISFHGNGYEIEVQGLWFSLIFFNIWQYSYLKNEKNNDKGNG